MHLTLQARILLYLCIKNKTTALWKRETFSNPVKGKKRNQGMVSVSCMAWHQKCHLRLSDVHACSLSGWHCSSFSCEFIEFLTKTTINSAWIPAIYMLAAELYMIHKCRKKFHLRVRLEKIQQMPKTIIFLLVFLVGLFQAIPMSVLERFMDLPDYMEQNFVNLAHNPIGILVLCIIAPIAEEYLIRGLMMRKMLRWNISPWYAIIGSSIMFGLIHLNPAQIPGPIILGIVMAWMCYRTRSLIPGIIIHITNNTLCLIPEECYDTYIASTPMIEGGLSLVSIAIVILSIWLFNKKTAAAS